MPPPLQTKDSEDSDEFYNADRPVGLLRWVNAEGQIMGEEPINYGNELIVGRDPSPNPGSKLAAVQTLHIPDDANHPFVSKRQFRIYTVIFDKRERSIQPLIYCEDLESTNGTYVNGICIGMLGRERVAHLLCHDDVIEVRPHWQFRLYQPPRDSSSHSHGEPEDLAYFLDRYVVSNRPLGSGQYGAVFLATEAATSKQIACKMIDFKNTADHRSQLTENPPDDSTVRDMSADEKATIKREIHILSRLSHPHIINLRKAFYSETTIYAFTDLAPGGDLFSYIDANEGPLTDCHARIVVRQLTLAVKYLHSGGIVHRDIKPENVLIMHTDLGGRVVLTDFGFATVVKSRGGRMMSKVGTYGYCAPEVDATEISKEGYTSAVDLYSLGKVTLFLLTNDAVLPRDSAGLSQLQQTELLQGLEDGRHEDIRRSLSPRALRFLRRLLVDDPAHRMTAEGALEHSWLTKPLSEAAAIRDCCAKIIRFWEYRVSNEVVEFLPQASRNKVEQLRKGSKFKRKLPDVSSSPYFGLDNHINPRKKPERRAVLDDLSKTQSQFVSAANESKASQPRTMSTHGSNMFGKSPDTQGAEQSSDLESISLVPTTPPVVRSTRENSMHLADCGPAGPSIKLPSKVDQTVVDSRSDVKSTGQKRVRWESEDPEEKRLREDVAKDGTKWRSARDLKIAVDKKKKKMDVQQSNGKGEPAHPNLTIRTSSRSFG